MEVAAAAAAPIAVEAAPLPMRAWRIVLVLGVIAILLFGHTYDIVSQTEHWPFSYYPMYAKVEKRRQVTALSLFLTVERNGKRQTVRATEDRAIPRLPALNEARLRVILTAAWNSGAGNNTIALRKVLADYLKLYESKRVAGEIRGPELLDARVYRVTWRLRPDGSAEDRPSRSDLIVTVPYNEALPR